MPGRTRGLDVCAGLENVASGLEHVGLMPEPPAMTVRIYRRRFGKLFCLYSLRRNPTGIYIGSGKSRGHDRVSYHEDGKWWSRFGNVKLKMLRAPLSSFTGQETLSVSMSSIDAPMPWDRDEASQPLRSDDLVLDLEGRQVGIEIALTDRCLTLPALPERLNSTTFIKKWRPPFLLVEAFELAGNMFPIGRFPSTVPRVDGQNIFFNHTGRI